jgi:ankyrin repeat protein
MELFEAVKTGNRETVKALIESGAEVNRQDKQGWTALNWAAAGGKVEMIELLLENGADPLAVGRDLRTPSMIALAAGQAEAVKVLRRAEGGGDAQPERQYAAAYHLEELRRYPGWPAAAESGTESGAESNGGQPEGHADDDFVFIHQDYRVMKSIWPDGSVIFADVTEQWKDYCRNELKFSVPDDLDLIGSPAEAPPSAA